MCSRYLCSVYFEQKPNDRLHTAEAIIIVECSKSEWSYCNYSVGNDDQPGLLGGGTLALCQKPRAPKGPRATAMIATTNDGSINQTIFIALGDELLSQLELN